MAELIARIEQEALEITRGVDEGGGDGHDQNLQAAPTPRIDPAKLNQRLSPLCASKIAQKLRSDMFLERFAMRIL
jgi:hypothetical protein